MVPLMLRDLSWEMARSPLVRSRLPSRMWYVGEERRRFLAVSKPTPWFAPVIDWKDLSVFGLDNGGGVGEMSTVPVMRTIVWEEVMVVDWWSFKKNIFLWISKLGTN